MEAYVEESLPARPRPAPSLYDRLRRSKEYLESLLPNWFGSKPVETTRFVWNPGVKQVRGNEHVVVCVDLPVSDPTAVLASYVRAGVAPDHVVFVGDATALSDSAYDGILKNGGLVQDVRPSDWNGKDRQQAEEELSAYFDAQAASLDPQYEPVKNPYRYQPAPRKISPDELQTFLDALAVRDPR
jgi:hypothetical protein